MNSLPKLANFLFRSIQKTKALAIQIKAFGCFGIFGTFQDSSTLQIFLRCYISHTSLEVLRADDDTTALVFSTVISSSEYCQTSVRNVTPQFGGILTVIICSGFGYPIMRIIKENFL